MSKSDIITYSEGLCYKSVCVPKDMTNEEIEAGVEPSGTRRGWRVSDETRFRSGHPNPCPCEDDPNRKHVLMDC